jgi:hypothetical protein
MGEQREAFDRAIASWSSGDLDTVVAQSTAE